MVAALTVAAKAIIDIATMNEYPFMRIDYHPTAVPMLRSFLACACVLIAPGAMAAATEHVPSSDKILECRIGTGRMFIKYATGSATRRNYRGGAGSYAEKTVVEKNPQFGKYVENCRAALVDMKIEALETRVRNLEAIFQPPQTSVEPPKAPGAVPAAGAVAPATAAPVAAAPPPIQRSCIEYVIVPGGTLTYFAYGLRNTCGTCVRAKVDHILDATRIAVAWDIQGGQTYMGGFSKPSEVSAAVEVTGVESCR